MTQRHLENLSILESHVLSAVGPQVLTKVQNFFSKIFAQNRWIRFDGQLPDNEVVILFLHFLVRYWPKREYGIFSFNFCIFIIEVSHSENSELVTGYPRSSMNRLLEKIMPLLPHFSKFLICWTSYEARKEAQRHFPSTIPEGMENVTLIVDATPLPIQHCRNDTKDGEEGVWDGAHQMWGMFLFH
jgi:hypothetical protein